MGPGDAGRGPGLLPLAAGRGQADASALAPPDEPADGARPVAGCAAGRTRRRCARTARRCCAASTTSTSTPAPGRSSTRSRWIGPGEAAGRTRTATRWTRHRNERAGLYRPTVPNRVPRSVPDEEFNEIFARLPSHRDRALVAFYVSTGARAPASCCRPPRAGPTRGAQLITVVRKGSRRDRRSCRRRPDAFVWLRLYQVEMDEQIPRGRTPPAVVDAARAVPAADLSRGAPDVRAGQRAGRHDRDAALAAPHRRLPDGRGPGPAADRCAVRPGPRPADHDADLSDAPQGGRGPPGAGPPRRADPAGRRAGQPRRRRPATGPRGWTCCSGTGRRDHRRRRRRRRRCVGIAVARCRRRWCRRASRPGSRPGTGRGLAGHQPGPRAGVRAADRRRRSCSTAPAAGSDVATG